MITENELIQLVEVQINKWANSIIDQYRIKPNSFKIFVKANKEHPKSTRYGYVIQDGSYHDYMQNDNSTVVRPKRTYIVKPNDLLHSHSSTLATVKNGTIVEITLFIPLMSKGDDFKTHLTKTIKRMKTTCKGLFKYISTPKLNRDEELFNPTVVGDILHEYILGADNTKVWRRSKYNKQVVNETHREEFLVERKREITFTHKDSGISYTVVDTSGKKTEWELEQEAWFRCSELVLNDTKSFVKLNTALVLHRYMDEVRLISQYVQNQTIDWN